MTAEVSNRIKICSLLCTLMVVYRHSTNSRAFFGADDMGSINACIQSLGDCITIIAVPFFFLISGYFFFKQEYYSKETYKKMLLKKERTLLLPFLAWNLVGFPFYLLSQKEGVTLNLPQNISDLFTSQYYAPLWYVRDLIILMITAPIYQWTLRTKNWYLQIIIVIALLAYWSPIDTSLCTSEGILFFYMGGILQVYKVNLSRNIHPLLVGVLMSVWLFSGRIIDQLSIIYLYKAYYFVGIVALWQMIGQISNKGNKRLLKVAGFSFFVYVTHFYVLKIMKVVLAKVFYGNEMVSCLSYLILPIITTVLMICIGNLLNKKTPKLYALVTGNRG